MPAPLYSSKTYVLQCPIPTGSIIRMSTFWRKEFSQTEVADTIASRVSSQSHMLEGWESARLSCIRTTWRHRYLLRYNTKEGSSLQATIEAHGETKKNEEEYLQHQLDDTFNAVEWRDQAAVMKHSIRDADEDTLREGLKRRARTI